MNKSNDDTLDFNCQDESRWKAIFFEQYVISARGGNIIAQYNIGYCYQYEKKLLNGTWNLLKMEILMVKIIQIIVIDMV